jgi:hypothetical protein
MAKERTNAKPTETPLERTRRLAQKLLAVPKREVQREQRKYQGDRERNKRLS